MDLDRLAKESGWSRKGRKVTALSWCMSLCMVSTYKAPSLRITAHVMGLINVLTISKQALHKRLNKGGAELLKKVLQSILASKINHSNNLKFGRFKRVLIQDSTNNQLPQSLKKDYPGSKNKNSSSAILKIQAIYDMVGNQFVNFTLSPFTRNDQAAALDILEVIEEGDLILRDLGYFTSESLRRIGSLKAYFLSRHHSGSKFYSIHNDEEINLLDLVKGKDKVDTDLLLGKKAKLPVRLLAVRLNEEVANNRRRKAKNNRDKRCNPSKEKLELLGWQILLTNCDRKDLKIEKACRIYSVRWRIETIFKAWKSGLGINEIGLRTSKPLLDALVLASLLRITLIHTVLIPWLEYRDPTRKVSICKLMDLISLSANLAGDDPQANENLLENISKHCRYDKRKRPNTLEQWDLLVSEMEGLS
jgi:hypothetical protein